MEYAGINNILLGDFFTLRFGQTQAGDLNIVSQILAVSQAEYDKKGFKACCKVAHPIFEYIQKAPKWSDVELAALSCVIGYHANYGITMELFQEILDILDSREAKYEQIRTALHYNFTHRLNRAICFDIKPTEIAKQKIASDLFYESYQHVMAVCEQSELLPRKYVLQVRRGIFENDAKLIDEGLVGLSKLGANELYRSTKNEIEEYLLNITNDSCAGTLCAF